MKKRIWTRRGFLALLLIGALLSLTACELPAQRSDPIQLDPGTQVQVPIVDPNLQPSTGVEGEQGAPLDGYPAPGGDPAAGGDGVVVVVPEGEQPAEVPAEGAVESAPDGVYVVQSGDTLGQIAQRFGVSIQDIAAASGLVNVDSLDVGQELTIPAAGFAEQQAAEAPPAEAAGERIHIVQRGDNLYRIGLLYGFTVEELTTYNGLVNPNSLDVGQEIKIPPG